MKQKSLIAFVSLTLAICSITACRPRQVVSGTETTRDTYTSKTETFRDTVIIAPGASVTAELDLNSLITVFKDDSGNVAKPTIKPAAVTKTDKHATVKVEIDPKGKLNVECRCDTLAITAKLRDTYEKQVSKTSTTNTVVQVQRKLPWWAHILIWPGVAAWCWILFTVGKIILKLLKYV